MEAQRVTLEQVRVKESAETEREVARIALEKEKLRVQLEMKKMEHEGAKTKREFDVGRNICLVPKFHEQEVDVFFLAFEKVANSLKWPSEYWSLLAQSAFTGRAQEIYAALDEEKSADYQIVKRVVLGAYELVPESYRQRFRGLQRKVGESHLEFARQKEMAFDRWCRAQNVNEEYGRLRQLILTEEFKNSMPPGIKAHLEDHKVDKLQKAAILADEFELSHRATFGKPRNGSYPGAQEDSGASGGRDFRIGGKVRTDRPGVPPGMPSGPICHYCRKRGHIKAECWKLQNEMGRDGGVKPVGLVSTGQESEELTEKEEEGGVKPVGVVSTSPETEKMKEKEMAFEMYKKFISEGSVVVDGKECPVVVLRDTGASQSLLLGKVGECKGTFLHTYVLIKGVGGEFTSVPMYQVTLRSKVVSGLVSVGVVTSLPVPGVDLILGNDLAGDKVYADPEITTTPAVSRETEGLQITIPGIFPACVVTRAQARVETEAEAKEEREAGEAQSSLASVFFADVESSIKTFTRGDLVRAQQGDPSVKKLYDGAITQEEMVNEAEGFYLTNDVLMRKWRARECPADQEWKVLYQVVLPPCYREDILKLAHDVPTAGHLGSRKTQAKVQQHFYWPKMHKDIVNFCRSCHACQVGGKPNQVIPKAPLIPIPAFEEPFTRVLIDCVGPLPKTKRGHQYLLTIMDVATRYPEGIPLRNIKAKTVLDALLKFFTQYGLAQEVQSDNGSNFMSGVFQEVMYELGIKQLKSSIYHPESQGALERHHQTLKTMIRTYCVDDPGDWDRGIPFLLFAARDAVNESTGFSPFELVFGHEVRGPLKLVKEKFLGQEAEVNILDYVSQFKARLRAACGIAREHLKGAQEKMKATYDQHVQERSFKVGDVVLVLLPIRGDPLHARFSGPYVVGEKISDVNYVINTPDRRKKKRLCHINMLKAYYGRGEKPVVALTTESLPPSMGDNEDDGITGRLEPVEVRLANSAVIAEWGHLVEHLQPGQGDEVHAVVQQFPSVFADTPGFTSESTHDIELVGEAKPIKQHPYRLNPVKMAAVRDEIAYMLEHGIIEPSGSDWSSPIVLVPKPDGSTRVCVDYRKVNAVTKADSYPIPRIEDCLDRIGSAKYVSKFDLLKGY